MAVDVIQMLASHGLTVTITNEDRLDTFEFKIVVVNSKGRELHNRKGKKYEAVLDDLLAAVVNEGAWNWDRKE